MLTFWKVKNFSIIQVPELQRGPQVNVLTVFIYFSNSVSNILNNILNTKHNLINKCRWQKDAVLTQMCNILFIYLFIPVFLIIHNNTALIAQHQVYFPFPTYRYQHSERKKKNVTKVLRQTSRPNKNKNENDKTLHNPLT